MCQALFHLLPEDGVSVQIWLVGWIYDEMVTMHSIRCRGLTEYLPDRIHGKIGNILHEIEQAIPSLIKMLGELQNAGQ